MNKRLVCLAAALLLLSGCSLEREYSVVEPHENQYWESTAEDILRAESYQDFVNASLLLVEQHEDQGTIRLYLTDVDYADAFTMVKNACAEVRLETAIGSYSLEALDFDMQELRNSYYQVGLLPVYRRTAEEMAAIVETASSSAIYELLLQAWKQGADRLTVRYAYLAEERESLLENIRQLQWELETGQGRFLDGESGGEAESEPAEVSEIPEELPEGYVPWEVFLYPPEGDSSIIEIILRPTV